MWKRSASFRQSPLLSASFSAPHLTSTASIVVHGCRTSIRNRALLYATSTVAPKKRSGILKKTVVALGLVAVGTGGLLTLPTDHSLCYIGERKEFEDEVERELHFKPSRVLPVGLDLFGKAMMHFSHEELKDTIVQIEKEHPKSIVPQTLLAYCLLHEGPTGYADGFEALKNAREKARLYPEANPQILCDYILPPLAVDEQLQEGKLRLDWPQEIKEIHSDKLWIISTGFRQKQGDPLPIPLQSSVFRCKDGSLVIINPAYFDEGTIAKINALGRVKALVTTTGGHSDCLATMSTVWPEAKLYGSDSKTKHRKPNLNWAGFIDNQSPNPLSDDFEVIHLDGHFFDENWFYNRETKSLLGLTDTGISTVPRADGFDWGLHIYHFVLGSWRGSKTKSIGSQSYHYLFAFKRPAMKQNVEKALQRWDIETIPLGHGGLLTGPGAKAALKDSYSWLLEPKAGEIGTWGTIHNGVAWGRRLPITSYIGQAWKLRNQGNAEEKKN